MPVAAWAKGRIGHGRGVVFDREARALLGGIARNTLYDLLRSGALASVPIGRRRFIAAEAIAAFIANASTRDGPLRGACPADGGSSGPADGGSAEPSSRERPLHESR
jgi:hypothetical protein